MSGPFLRDVRDGAVLVEFPGRSNAEANRAAVLLGARLRRTLAPGLRDAVPAARTLLALFDPARLSRRRLEAEIARGAAGPSHADADADSGRLIRLPVAYGGADLPDLARAARISEEEFGRRHAAALYRVAFIGFAPGFPYLTGLPGELSAPRLSSPRTRVPSGSVAIGGGYTGIYPGAMPGGWRLIGRTTASLFDAAADPPALLAAGDRIRFEAVRTEELPAPRPGPRNDPERESPPLFRVVGGGGFASVQGGPRWGLASSGVPPGGAMDREALAAANALVGNPVGAPGVEATLLGPELEVLADAVIAAAGADLIVGAERSGRSEPAGGAVAVSAGDRVRLGRLRGVRAYVAVRGGFAPSRPAEATRRLEAGDPLYGGRRGALRSPEADVQRGTLRSSDAAVRVVAGPQADRFSLPERRRFLETLWRVSSQSDRRGLRLEGNPLAHAAAPEIVPEGTVFGSVQVPGSGLPIVIGPDGPVTGGYPKIATVIEADLPLLGRAIPGDALRFREVSIEEALRSREP